ncbi:cytochrome P450 family protein [Streptomyces iconiensis]|uniref:Cytochrome P450 n=1 Tax=Streptomyces iconiensis TaxID=1384038 RepID=A0ABT6ZWR3_9ACTN|nr:cytochrome P450 [Streptomyces iconiensis]MDJ1132838.1 cytochrome P450 [Streptomyces iconiensis]
MADHSVVDTTADEHGIVDLAAMGERFSRDPYPVYAALRARGPVHRVRTPEGPLAWLVVGHRAVRDLLGDERLSKAWANASPEAGTNVVSAGTHMLVADPPDHTRLRKLIAKEFTPRRVAALEPRVREITDALLDAMLARPDGRADLVESLAFPLPISVICELLGVPSLDRERFRAWSDEVLGTAPADQKATSVRTLGGYLVQLLERCREDPGDDLLGALVRTSDEDGDQLSSDELLGMAWLLLIAGYETTVSLLANGTLALLRHPDQLAALRADPSLIEGAVEEMLRYDGPVEVSTYRFTTAPIEVGGTVIPGDGQLVLPVLADADRDPERFPDPDRFDIRRETRGHLAFGHGIHFCLGAPLARMEARIAFERLLERAPKLELDAHPDSLRWREGLLMRGVTGLPVRFG